MAPPVYWWFKMPCDRVLADPRIMRLTPEQRWLYTVVYALARKSTAEPGLVLLDGVGVPTADEVARAAGPGYTGSDVTTGVERMVEVGLVQECPWPRTESTGLAVAIVDWAEDQPPGSGKSTERANRSKRRRKEQEADEGQDDGEDPAPSDPPRPAGGGTKPDRRLGRVASILGENAARRARDAGTLTTSFSGYRAAVVADRKTDPSVHALLLEYPERTPDQVAELWWAGNEPAAGSEALSLVPDYVPADLDPDALDREAGRAAARAARTRTKRTP
jgi:hypothetical protein